MASAKDIVVKPISSADGNALIRRLHYSGKVVTNSQLHLGVFLDGRLEGAMSFGPSLDKRKMLGLVPGTSWNGFIELNRMAFSERLPRNSESRAIAYALRLIRKEYPHIEWVISFADATQCGDGTIYRAAGFTLTSIKRNADLLRTPDGKITHSISVKTGRDRLLAYAKSGGASRVEGEPLDGFQLRYIYFLNPQARKRLAVPELPYSAIQKAGAGMYRGNKAREACDGCDQHSGGGETPTRALHLPGGEDAAQSKAETPISDD